MIWHNLKAILEDLSELNYLEELKEFIKDCMGD